VAFTRVTMGDSSGGDGPEATRFASTWDQDCFDEMLGVWFARGHVTGGLVDVDELSRIVGTVLSTDVTVSSIVVRQPPAASG
jgi:hypothetical protein